MHQLFKLDAAAFAALVFPRCVRSGPAQFHVRAVRASERAFVEDFLYEPKYGRESINATMRKRPVPRTLS